MNQMTNHILFNESIERFITAGEIRLERKKILDLGAVSIEYLQELLWPALCIQLNDKQWLNERQFVVGAGNYLCALYKKIWEEMGFYAYLIEPEEVIRQFQPMEDLLTFSWGVAADLEADEKYIHFPGADFINILTSPPLSFPVLAEQFIPLTPAIRPIVLYGWSGLFLCSHWAKGFWKKRSDGAPPHFLETVKKCLVAEYIRYLIKESYLSSKGVLLAQKIFPLLIWPDFPIKDLLQYHLDSYKESEGGVVNIFRKELLEGNEASVVELLEAMVEFPVTEFRIYGRVLAEVLRYPEISALYKEAASFWRDGSVEEVAILAARLRTFSDT